MRDVIEGHCATGEFAPHLWHVLLEHDRPIAVLLLNRSIHANAMELVYIGLAPTWRGRGIADLLMRLAIFLSAHDGKRELTLAVDSRNVPAMRLYFRHGFKRVGSRTAMILDLRSLRSPQSPSADVALIGDHQHARKLRDISQPIHPQSPITKCTHGAKKIWARDSPRCYRWFDRHGRKIQ